MKAAIAIDSYKLAKFDQHLKQAGFEYEKRAGIVKGTLTLTVETDDIEALAAVIREANAGT